MTIDTSQEAVERLLDGVTPGPWGSRPDDEIQGAHVIHGGYYEIALFTGGYPEAAKDLAFIAASRELVPALLAERDAALAEVARLSTPPDDAEVVALVAEHRKIAKKHAGSMFGERSERTADALTRLSHALAAEREAIEVKGGNEHAPTQWAYDRACDALRATKDKLEAIKAAGLAVLQNADRPGSRACLNCGPDGEDTWIDYQEVDQSVLDVLSATLAEHGSKT